MRVIIIGGSGHIGTYLVPRLVQAGHEVINVSRGKHKPYLSHSAWEQVQQVILDRADEESAGTFGKKICDFKPDVVVDLICFTLESAQHLAGTLSGNIQHFLHCSTVWVHGSNVLMPTVEDQPRQPIDDYGVKKAAIEAYLLHEARLNGFPVTTIMPGHIVGQGWIPLNPLGNFNPDIFEKLARGETLILPNFGLETLHHVHADAVAQAFMTSLTPRSTAVGENFHAVSPQAITLRGYAEAVSTWFGKKANLRFSSWDEWRTTVSEKDAEISLSHLSHSSHCSIEKARKLIDYYPRYTSLEAIFESLAWLLDKGELKII